MVTYRRGTLHTWGSPAQFKGSSSLGRSVAVFFQYPTVHCMSWFSWYLGCKAQNYQVSLFYQVFNSRGHQSVVNTAHEVNATARCKSQTPRLWKREETLGPFPLPEDSLPWSNSKMSKNTSPCRDTAPDIIMYARP